ncbi:MAG: Fic family protein [Candidatus Peregrinibacteria bacterium]
MSPQFIPFNLQLVAPDFGDHLTDIIVELDYLRKKELGGTTPIGIFFQIKDIFHLMESLGSARIEGNHTTIAEAIEHRIHPEENTKETFLELENNEKAIQFVERHIKDSPISGIFIREIHKIIVQGLEREGSQYSGQWRPFNVAINKSSHLPPDTSQVSSYMQELVDFINTEDAPKYDLLKVAIAHHRFAWIHPFDNGTGRTVRALTYAMLIKQGFLNHESRIINPTAIFCSDRNKYYEMLSKADTGERKGVLEWCEYVLSGLKTEIEKTDQLTNYTFLRTKIIDPALKMALERKYVTEKEYKILYIASQEKILQASDLKKAFSDKIPAEVSRMIRGLKEKKMILPLEEGGRKYQLHFSQNVLMRCIVKMLDQEGFLPIQD